jgi:hypothetical protein
MFSIANAESLIGMITIFIAYLAVIGLAGFARAWTASAMGDDTPERLGFLTINPAAHLDLIGALFVVFFGFGWGQHIPINPLNIDGPWERLKVVIAYLSDTIAHLLMALSTLVILIGFFGVKILLYAQPLIVRYNFIKFSAFTKMYPTASPIALVFVLIGFAFIYLNVLLAVLHFIINGFNAFAYLVWNKDALYWRYRDMSMVLIPMLLIFFFIDPLRFLAAKMVMIVGTIISTTLGIV